MTTKDEQLYGDIDDLLMLAGGYLTALKQHGKNDKLVKITQRVITEIQARYQDKINELNEPVEPHPDAITFKR